ncbi:MAG TPA: DUF4339 domain-containing protein, partial [Anaeromyxobacteraceae bacterium]|nr:DUF4339 domain-containing protein [Anaeromyxobacteraceae bacterium]
MIDAAWYYDDAGRQAGPISEGQLGELIQAARLAPRTRVWTAGMAAWQPWESVPALAAFARAGGPPPLDAATAAPPFSGNSYAADVL